MADRVESGPSCGIKTGVETIMHSLLQTLAVEFLRSLGSPAAATEVRCPIARYRVDVAGYLDRWPDVPAVGAGPGADRRRPSPRTVIIECKCSRGDFLRDRGETDRLLAHRDALDRMRRGIEERRIKAHEPHLRRSGSSLFPELEQWDFAASRLRGYRQVVRDLRRIDRALYGQTKFFMVARYALADRLYLAAPRGMIRPRELPRGWGLLECAPPARALGTAVEAPELPARPEHRARLLRNIAASACRHLARLRDLEPAPAGVIS